MKLEVLVPGHQNGEVCGFGRLQQGAILQAGPRFLLNGSNSVASQEGRELPRQLLIEQNAHEPSPLHGPLPELPQPVHA